MKTILYFFKLTITFSLVVFLAQVLIHAVAGDSIPWSYVLLASPISGAVVASLLLPLHEYRLRKIGYSLFDGGLQVFDVSQKANYESEASRETLVAKLQAHARQNLDVISENSIVYRTTSWFGLNKLTITFLPGKSNKTRINITSSSKVLPTVIFDYGESFIRLVQLERVLGLKRISRMRDKST